MKINHHSYPIESLSHSLLPAQILQLQKSQLACMIVSDTSRFSDTYPLSLLILIILYVKPNHSVVNRLRSSLISFLHRLIEIIDKTDTLSGIEGTSLLLEVQTCLVLWNPKVLSTHSRHRRSTRTMVDRCRMKPYLASTTYIHLVDRRTMCGHSSRCPFYWFYVCPQNPLTDTYMKCIPVAWFCMWVVLALVYSQQFIAELLKCRIGTITQKRLELNPKPSTCQPKVLEWTNLRMEHLQYSEVSFKMTYPQLSEKLRSSKA